MAKHKKPKPQKKSGNTEEKQKILYITAILSLINGLILLINNIISLIKTLIQ